MARTGLSVTIAKKLKLTEFLLTSVTVTDYGAVPPLSERIVDW